jgi:retron-type reverse transcriptase
MKPQWNLLSGRATAGSVARGNNNRNNYNNRRNVNANNRPSNRLGMTSFLLSACDCMKTFRNLFQKLCSYENLLLAFRKAKKRKSKKPYVIEFEKNLKNNLFRLQWELMTQTYTPRPMTTFTVRDPKTRKISASNFRDRVIHHAICNIIEPIFEKRFIHDTYANRRKKGTSAALKRFDFFLRKVTGNGKHFGGGGQKRQRCGRLRPQGRHKALFRNSRP